MQQVNTSEPEEEEAAAAHTLTYADVCRRMQQVNTSEPEEKEEAAAAAAAKAKHRDHDAMMQEAECIQNGTMPPPAPFFSWTQASP
jgi:hypothetical protein